MEGVYHALGRLGKLSRTMIRIYYFFHWNPNYKSDSTNSSLKWLFITSNFMHTYLKYKYIFFFVSNYGLRSDPGFCSSWAGTREKMSLSSSWNLLTIQIKAQESLHRSWIRLVIEIFSWLPNDEKSWLWCYWSVTNPLRRTEQTYVIFNNTNTLIFLSTIYILCSIINFISAWATSLLPSSPRSRRPSRGSSRSVSNKWPQSYK